MCKWEWPFVFTETRANKYPFRTEASVFNIYLLYLFLSFSENRHLKAKCDLDNKWIVFDTC